MRLLLVAVPLPGLLIGQALAPRPADAVPAEAFAHPDAAIFPDARRIAVRTGTELHLFPLVPNNQPGTPMSCNVADLEPQCDGVEHLDEQRLIPTSDVITDQGAAPIHVVCCGA